MKKPETKIVIDADGVHEEPMTEDEVVEVSTREATKTAARAHLEELQAQSGALIVECEINGRKWFIKRLSWPLLVELALSCPRDKKNRILLAPAMNLATCTKAMFMACVANGIDDEAPYFNAEDASDYVDAPAASSTVSQLFDEVTNLNPDILPKKKTVPNPSSTDTTNEPPAS